MSTIIERARELRSVIEENAAQMDDAKAVQYPELFAPWCGDGISYAADDRVNYEGVLYKVLQDHTSQPDWTPDTAASLYVRVDDPAEEWPQWRQPSGAQDAYEAGYKVSHNEKHWVSTVDANVWEPGVYGWDEVAE